MHEAGGRLTRRLVVVAAVVAVLAGTVTSAARADGDPASDVLYFQDVFLSYAKPSDDVAKQLTTTVAAANKSGFRIKVAVIQSEQDLGSVPSLFNQQMVYAHFLGAELKLFYADRLLVVMPGGFGIYDNGKPVTREQSVLAGLTVDSPDSDGLTKAATAAVTALRKAIGTTGKKDTKAPTVKALAATATPGTPAKLRYTVFDASGRSKEVVRVYGPSYLLFATIVTRLAKAKPKQTRTVVWRVPKQLDTTKLQFCVAAEDKARNQSKPSCAPIRVAS